MRLEQKRHPVYTYDTALIKNDLLQYVPSKKKKKKRKRY